MSKPQNETLDEDNLWSIVESAIINIFNQEQTNLSQNQIEGAVESLISMNQSSKITEGFNKLIKDQFLKWHENLSGINGNQLLVSFSSFYTNFKKYCLDIPQIFIIYDKSFEGKTENEESETHNQLCSLFKDILLTDSNLITNLNDAILSEVHNSRYGSEVDLTVLKNLIEMYSSFQNNYATLFTDFFDRFKNETKNFYN